jgi:hypothetical protein
MSCSRILLKIRLLEDADSPGIKFIGRRMLVNLDLDHARQRQVILVTEPAHGLLVMTFTLGKVHPAENVNLLQQDSAMSLDILFLGNKVTPLPAYH